jgi:CSLREA domain-containing protein
MRPVFSRAPRAARRPRLCLELLEDRTAPAVITVNTAIDDLTPNDGTVSLREAITAINAGNDLGDPDLTAQNPGTFGSNDTIHFNLVGNGVHTINVGSDASASGQALPLISKPVVIDGTSQPGFGELPVIELNGTAVSGGGNGFTLSAGGITIKGFVINRFPGNGVLIDPNDGLPGGDVVETCFIGTDSAGALARANAQNGIVIAGAGSSDTSLTAADNVISNNVISGNTLSGIFIDGGNRATAGNAIQNNFIGLDAGGTHIIGNGHGVVIANGASGNIIGGAGGGFRNVITGNMGAGILLAGTLSDLTTDNQVFGNYIGTDLTGKAAAGGIGNAIGVLISGAVGNIIGGPGAGANVIGFNTQGIVLCNGAQRNIIQDNFIGVASDGLSPINNTLHGVAVTSSNGLAPPLGPSQVGEPPTSNNSIGGDLPGQGNTIAFNGSAGVAVFGNPVSASGVANTGNTIEDNAIFRNGLSNPPGFVGIDLSNSSAFPNDDGATLNDSKGHGAANDPNNFQNAPILFVATALNGTAIAGTLAQTASPNTTFRLEFFASNADPGGGPAEGQTFLGFATVQTDANGVAGFNVKLPPQVKVGQLVTATATDAAGNTSEFSSAVTAGDADAGFVAKTFLDLLGHVPSAADSAGPTQALDNGTVTPGQFALAVMNDPGHEFFTHIVAACYQFYLHRPEAAGDASEAAGQVQFLATGGSFDSVRAFFGSKTEYFLNRGGGTNDGFVNALYLDAFNTPNRVATDPGAQAAVAALFGGTATRSSVATAIFTSDEFRGDFAKALFGTFMGRAASADEINKFAGQLKSGASDQAVIANVLGLGESFDDGVFSPNGQAIIGNPPPSGRNGIINLQSPQLSFNAEQRDALGGVFAFRDPTDSSNVNFGNTVLAVTVSPFAGVLTPLGFDPRMTLNLNVVNVTGHLTPDFTFRFTFAAPSPSGSNFTQVVNLNLIQGATTTLIAQYTYAGNQTIPPPAFANNITFSGDAIATGKFIAGIFDDPTFEDAQGLSNQLRSPATTTLPRTAPTNFFKNSNTLGIVLEVPTVKLTTANPPLLGVWATTSVNGTQVDRLGRPLLDELLVPPVPRGGTDKRQAFEQGSPSTDVANFRTDLLNSLTGQAGPYQRTAVDATAVVDNTFGSTIVGANTGLLPNILTVDLSKQFTDPTSQGYPNGRRLRDDVTDTQLQLFTGKLSAGDAVGDDNGTLITDGTNGTTAKFPFLGAPNNPPAGPNL